MVFFYSACLNHLFLLKVKKKGMQDENDFYFNGFERSPFSFKSERESVLNEQTGI
jgi:hypothetical protein